jgi:hypothetical protein
MQENIRADFNKLSAYCIPAAKHFLREQNGEFYPFGAYIDRKDEIIPSGIYDGDEFPLSDTVIRQFESVFEKWLSSGEIKAYAIAFDSRVTNDVFPDKIDAIATRMRHCDSDDTFVFYFPYKINGNDIQLFESFGEVAPHKQ